MVVSCIILSIYKNSANIKSSGYNQLLPNLQTSDLWCRPACKEELSPFQLISAHWKACDPFSQDKFSNPNHGSGDCDAMNFHYKCNESHPWNQSFDNVFGSMDSPSPSVSSHPFESHTIHHGEPYQCSSKEATTSFLANNEGSFCTNKVVEGQGSKFIEPMATPPANELGGLRRHTAPQLAGQLSGGGLDMLSDSASADSSFIIQSPTTRFPVDQNTRTNSVGSVDSSPVQIATLSLASSPTGRKLSVPESSTEISSGSATTSFMYPESTSSMSTEEEIFFSAITTPSPCTYTQASAWPSLSTQLESTLNEMDLSPTFLPQKHMYPELEDYSHQDPYIGNSMFADAPAYGRELISPLTGPSASATNADLHNYEQQIADHGMEAFSFGDPIASNTLNMSMIPHSHFDSVGSTQLPTTQDGSADPPPNDDVSPSPSPGVQSPVSSRDEGTTSVLQCDRCDFRPTGKLANHRAYLRKHKKTHAKTIIKCKECNKVFTRRDNATAHFKRAHRSARGSVAKRPAFPGDGQERKISPKKRVQKSRKTL